MPNSWSSGRGWRIGAWLLVVGGASLLALTASWYIYPFPAPSVYKDEKGTPIKPRPPEVANLRSQEALVDAIAKSGRQSPREIAKRAFELVSARFDTCYGSRFTTQQNWILGLAGLVVPESWLYHNEDTLIRYSDCGLCSQVNGTMVLALFRLGVPARLVNLPGHVVAEVEWDGRWHMVDPHFGFFPTESQEEVDVAVLARDPSMVTSLYANLLEPHVLELTRQSFEGYALHPRPPQPVGSTNEPVLARAKRLAEVAKWVLPTTALALGCAILVWSSRCATG